MGGFGFFELDPITLWAVWLAFCLCTLAQHLACF